jgi:lipopolysaccharide cholinephosphotransferase
MANSKEKALRKAQLKMLDMLIAVDKICKDNNLKYWIDAGTLLGAVRHGGFIPWDDDLDICMPREDYNNLLSLLDKELPKDFAVESVENNFHNKMPWLRILYMKDFECTLKSGTKHIGLCMDVFPMDLMDVSVPDKPFTKLFTKVVRQTRRNSKKNLRNFAAGLLNASNPSSIWLKYLSTQNRNSKDLKYGYGVETGFCSPKYLYDKSFVFPLSEIEYEGLKFSCPNDYHNYLTVEYGNYMELPPVEERVPHVLELKYIGSN